MSHAANIYLAFGFEPVPGAGYTITQGNLPTSFTNSAIATQGATAINGYTPYKIDVTTPGAVIQMRVVCLIANNDGNYANDGLSTGYFSMDSLPTTPQNLLGNYSQPFGVAAGMSGTGSSLGTLANTDSDTDIDLGRNHNPTGTGSSTIGFNVATSDGNALPIYPGAAGQTGNGYTKFVLGSVNWTVGNSPLVGDKTFLELFPVVTTAARFIYSSDASDVNAPANNANFGGVSAGALANENTAGGTNRRLYWFNGGLVPLSTGTANPNLTQTNPGIEVTFVPEPGTVALLGLGMLGLVACARRRRA